MSQTDQQSNVSDLLPEAPINNTKDVTQDPSPITKSVSAQHAPPTGDTRLVSIQEHEPIIHTHPVSSLEHPPTVHSHRVSIQEPTPILHSRRVSIQEPTPILHSRRVSIQEPTPILHSRRVSIQEPTPILHSRRVSIQEPTPILHSHRVSIQEPTSILHSRRVSIQEPTSILHSRQVSIQEPTPILHSRQVSIQESPPVDSNLWVSIKETPSISNISQKSIQETPSISNLQVSSQDTPSVTHSSHFNTQNVPSGLPTSRFSLQKSPVLIPMPLSSIESVAYTSLSSSQEDWTSTQSHHLSLQSFRLPFRASVDIPPSITDSPSASIESMESTLWTSQDEFKESFYKFQFNGSLDSTFYNTPSGGCVENGSSRFQTESKRRKSQLPIGTRLLHEAKKISRQLSLVLSLVGMVIISLITLGQPWIHFWVPLTPPGDPADPLTIPISTIFFVRCSDISCLREQDRNAYLLDSAWAFFFIASISGFCLCIILINITFFTSSNLPLLDFSNIIISVLTGTSMILGVLFYLMQARLYLQEGMTYKLARSFYLAWTSIFFFLTIGFLSYLNYMNFWFILAHQAIWA